MLNTCLLVSDDPDDHVEFAEAVQEVSGNTALVVVMDPDKAIQLLAMKKIIPDLVIVDVAISGFRHEIFFATMQDDPVLTDVPLVAYGEIAGTPALHHPRISFFLQADITYSGLRSVLVDVMRGF